MTLRHMTILCALFENDCNTTKTAEALNMTQPAISQAIREMEQYYGTKLFDRIGRKLYITDAGKSLLRRAKQISSLFDEAETELRDIDCNGRLSVGASLTIGSLFLPRYIKVFGETHPESKVNAIVAPTNVLEEKILSYELDFAFIEGIAHDPDIIIEDYMDDELCIVAAANGKYSSEQVISPDEFKKEKILVREMSSGTYEVFERATRKIGFSVKPAFESFSTTALINGALSGIGVAVLPYRVAYPYIRHGSLIRIYVSGLDLKRKFFLIRHKDKLLSTAAKEFLDSCRNYESEHPVPLYIK